MNETVSGEEEVDDVGEGVDNDDVSEEVMLSLSRGVGCVDVNNDGDRDASEEE